MNIPVASPEPSGGTPLAPREGTAPLRRLIMLRSAYYAALQTLGLPALARRLRDGGVILCYHNVAPTGDAPLSGEPGVHLSLEKFASQVEWLARHYDVVPLHELLDRLAARRPLRDLAAITFDDGYRGVFEHAWPLLLELGLPATVFVVADAPETGDPFWWDHPAAAQRATPELREHWLKDLRGDGAGIISAVMGSDAHQVLALSTMFTPAFSIFSRDFRKSSSVETGAGVSVDLPGLAASHSSCVGFLLLNLSSSFN